MMVACYTSNAAIVLGHRPTSITVFRSTDKADSDTSLSIYHLVYIYLMIMIIINKCRFFVSIENVYWFIVY